MRKKGLLKEIEVILEKKLKCSDHKVDKMIRSLYKGDKHKQSSENPKAQEVDNSNRELKKQKVTDEDFKDCANIVVEGDFKPTSEVQDTNTSKQNELDIADVGIEGDQPFEQHSQTDTINASKAADDGEAKEKEHKDYNTTVERYSEVDNSDIDLPLQDEFELANNQNFDRCSQSSAKNKSEANHKKDDDLASEKSSRRRSGSRKKHLAWLEDNDTRKSIDNEMELGRIRKLNNLGSGIQSKKMKQREEELIAHMSKTKRFMKESLMKPSKPASALESTLFSKQDSESHIRSQEKALKEKKRELKYKTLASAALTQSDFLNFTIDSHSSSKKKFKYPLVSFSRLFSTPIFFTLPSPAHNYIAKQRHLALLNHIDISKSENAVRGFSYLEDSARSNLIMEMQQVQVIENLQKSDIVDGFQAFDIREHIPFELRQQDEQVAEFDSENVYMTREERELGFSWANATKRVEIRELKKHIWNYIEKRVPKKPKDERQIKQLKDSSFFDVVGKFYFSQFEGENKQSTTNPDISIHSLFV